MLIFTDDYFCSSKFLTVGELNPGYVFYKTPPTRRAFDFNRRYDISYLCWVATLIGYSYRLLLSRATYKFKIKALSITF